MLLFQFSGKKNNIKIKKYILRTRKRLMILTDVPDFLHYSYIELCLLLTKDNNINEKSIINNINKKFNAIHDLTNSQNVRKKYTLLCRVLF